MGLSYESVQRSSRSLQAASDHPQNPPMPTEVLWIEMLRLLVETTVDGRPQIRHSQRSQVCIESGLT